MQHFYDGQIRRYLVQIIRLLSNFTVRYADGTLHRIPVLYGDADRQVANIIRQNSENVVNSVPRISVYISGLELDKDRLGDASFVGKLHVREREIQNNTYTRGQGRNYTVERIMPTPFKLSVKADIWSANTDQKLQILEQILVLFNPSLELQTTDNYVDWTSLSVLNLAQTSWSSRSVPVGNDSPIDIATLTFDSPIWISPPVKIKHLGVITKIITSIYDGAEKDDSTYIEGLGHPLISGGDTTLGSLLSREVVTITDYRLQIYNNIQGIGQAILLANDQHPKVGRLEVPEFKSNGLTWFTVLEKYPGKYVAGSSMLYLTQPNGSEIVGTVAVNPLDDSILTVTWDIDTLTTNTGIDSQGRLDTDPDYDGPGSYRSNSPGTFDRIVDPLQKGPGSGLDAPTSGTRYLLVEDIGNEINDNPSIAWGLLVAKANDIIEWDGNRWNVIFAADQEPDTMIWQTNIYTGVQYVWNGVYWTKSFEGEYAVGSWRLEL